MTHKHSLFDDVISIFSSKILLLALTFIGSVILARALNAEGRGILAAALIYPQLLLAITEGGMRQAATYFIGQKKAPDSEVFAALFCYIITASIAGVFMIYSLMFWFGADYFDNAMMIVTALILPCSLAVNALNGIFLGKQNIKGFSRVIWIQKLVYVVAIFILYLLNALTVFSAIIVTALAALFNFLQAFKYLKKSVVLSFSFNGTTLFNMLRMGVIYAIAFFLITANYKIDILLLGFLASPEQLGNYLIAAQIGELCWQLPAAILVVMLSKGANTNQKNERFLKSVCQISRLTVAITLITLLMIIFVAYYLIVPTYGADYNQSFMMLVLLAPGLLIATIFKSINTYFAGQGKPYYAIIVMGTAVIANITLNYALIPLYGGNGAAVASSISYAISSVLALYIFSKKLNVQILDVILVTKDDISHVFEQIKNKLQRI